MYTDAILLAMSFCGIKMRLKLLFQSKTATLCCFEQRPDVVLFTDSDLFDDLAEDEMG